MVRRSLAILLMLGLLSLSGGVLQAAETKPHIVDPLGDANFVNDQGTGDGSTGDQNAADAGTVSDLLEVTFTNDAKNLYVTIRTEAAPPAATGIGYRVRVNPEGAGGTHCLFFEAFFPGANNDLTAPKAQLRDGCAGETTEVETLGTMIVVPRNLHPALGKGKTLSQPQAQAFLYTGTYPTGVAGPMADTTKVGTDYKLRK